MVSVRKSIFRDLFSIFLLDVVNLRKRVTSLFSCLRSCGMWFEIKVKDKPESTVEQAKKSGLSFPYHMLLFKPIAL